MSSLIFVLVHFTVELSLGKRALTVTLHVLVTCKSDGVDESETIFSGGRVRGGR